MWSIASTTAAWHERQRASVTARFVALIMMGSWKSPVVNAREWCQPFNAFVQYNGEADSWLSNVRFNLIHRPLSDIYVVWNETRLPGSSPQRALLMKYTHLIAF